MELIILIIIITHEYECIIVVGFQLRDLMIVNSFHPKHILILYKEDR